MPSHGRDVAAGVGVVAEFAAQVGNVDIDEVLVPDPVGSPDDVNELATGEGHRGSSSQRDEGGPVPVGSEGHLGVGQVDAMTVGVNTECPDHSDRFAARGL